MKKIAVIGVRGYPYVYGGYETLVKEISERLSTENFSITVYCHKNLFSHRPKSIKNIQLVYISSLPYKIFASFSHSFLSTLLINSLIRSAFSNSFGCEYFKSS